LAQAEDVKARLLAAHKDLTPDDIGITVIKTTGDKVLGQHLMNLGGKGLFTKEIEDALLEGDIDCAVHSSKDMPTQLPDGLTLSTFLPREDPRDVFISPKFSSFLDLPKAATLGTASLRRRAQALRLRPDLKVVTFRGNVQTRLRKLNEGAADATFLALAGLNRLSMTEVATEKLSLQDFLPAPAQGAVVVEVRDGDTKITQRLSPLHHEDTALAVAAERAFLASIDGSCRTPVAALAARQGDTLLMQVQLLSVDGIHCFEATDSTDATLDHAVNMGGALGEKIRLDAGQQFFDDLIRQVEEEIQ
jgi:hydroxymethylbilane synthase